MVFSICHRLMEEIAFVHVSCSCDVHRLCALGFDMDATPRVKANVSRRLTHQVAFPNPALHARCTKRWNYTPFFNRSVVSADRRARERRQPQMSWSPQLSSAPPRGPSPQPER